MRWSFVLSLTIACSLLAATAGAQGCVPGGRPISPDYERDSPAEWAQEAGRFKSSAQLVSRQHDHLRLALDGGRTVELADCPFGDDAYRFLYERYDQAGRFHVVRKAATEDLSYILVMLPTGRQFTVHGAPVWASDKSRFLTIGCSLEPPRGHLLIQAPAGEELATEAEFPLPCDSESCSARWDHGSWISVTCVPRDSSGKRGSEFVLTRSSSGTWNKFGR
jgi:hypothetical protein